ncbi:MAG: autoinducer binding domain-containing protein [Gammaproteobacteria bacterium]|nr:autoinducer binding domain-containing protein [Gammaproteobacteria bacterium]
MTMRVDHYYLGMFADELLSATSLDERFGLYERYVCGLGFDAATYTYIPNIQLNTHFPTPPVFAFTESYPVAFLKHYGEARFDEDDFTIRKVMGEKCMNILDWREHERQQQISAAENHVIVVAREEYGIRNALTIPTMTGAIGIAGASVVSSEKDASFQLLKEERLGTLLKMTQIFHAQVFANQELARRFLKPFLESLSQKEIDILRHLARGEAFKNIEYSVDVASYKVAANILDKLRAKFGGITRDRLMFLIGLLNLLDQE